MFRNVILVIPGLKKIPSYSLIHSTEKLSNEEKIMAVQAGTVDFNKWLKDELCKLNIDENIFGSYIIGILEGDESHDEKTEALQEILSEITNNDLDTIVNGIIEKWNNCHLEKPKDDKKPILEDVDTQLAKILESKINQTTVQRQYTADELRIREQILAQYSQQEVDEDDNISDEENHSGLVKNTNAQDVQQAMKERREQAKLESQKKKEKDKEDREKQKQMKEEKKEKRKTVKGERRR